MNNLSGITRMDIDYLTSLDYLSLRKLCATNNQFKSICNDQKKLRTLLMSKNPLIILPLHLDIAKILDEFYRFVITIVNENYPILPKWVIKSLFMEERIKDTAKAYLRCLSLYFCCIIKSYSRLRI